MVGEGCVETEDKGEDSVDGGDELGGTGEWPSTTVNSYTVMRA